MEVLDMPYPSCMPVVTLVDIKHLTFELMHLRVLSQVAFEGVVGINPMTISSARNIVNKKLFGVLVVERNIHHSVSFFVASNELVL